MVVFILWKARRTARQNCETRDNDSSGISRTAASRNRQTSRTRAVATHSSNNNFRKVLPRAQVSRVTAVERAPREYHWVGHRLAPPRPARPCRPSRLASASFPSGASSMLDLMAPAPFQMLARAQQQAPSHRPCHQSKAASQARLASLLPRLHSRNAIFSAGRASPAAAARAASCRPASTARSTSRAPTHSCL